METPSASVLHKPFIFYKMWQRLKGIWSKRFVKVVGGDMKIIFCTKKEFSRQYSGTTFFNIYWVAITGNSKAFRIISLIYVLKFVFNKSNLKNQSVYKNFHNWAWYILLTKWLWRAYNFNCLYEILGSISKIFRAHEFSTFLYKNGLKSDKCSKY